MIVIAHDVVFPESPVLAPSCPPDPGDNDSVLTDMTTLDLSDDEMSTDGDSMAETKDEEQQREPMRSEAW